MAKKIYKYLSPNPIEKVFYCADSTALKCSLPKDFNDPYELFLTIDFNQRAEALAFYADAIGELPQLPTTCFSRSPTVVPMWAHYAKNQQGFVIEFCEDRLTKAFPKSRLGDVRYLDAPKDDLVEILYRAYEIGKPRYTYMLQGGVFNAAYFTKASCWNYEQECRLVLHEADTRKLGLLTLTDVTNECIAGIVCGPRASKKTKAHPQ